MPAPRPPSPRPGPGGPHEFEALRDVPKSCICPWDFKPARWAYTLTAALAGCPWHGGNR